VAEPLTLADQRQALARLRELADELGMISTWLTRLDLDQPAIVLECAWRDLHAAAGLLEAPRPAAPRAG
jgi:hypothetical protein